MPAGSLKRRDYYIDVKAGLQISRLSTMGLCFVLCAWSFALGALGVDAQVQRTSTKYKVKTPSSKSDAEFLLTASAATERISLTPNYDCFRRDS